jgi:peptide/nickel transport system substrate-binding protein
MFRRKLLAVVAGVAAVALTLAGCGGGAKTTTGGSSAGTSGGGGTLTLGLIATAATFSAQDMEFANQSPYGQAVYDTLLKADPQGKIGPSLAKEWTYDATKTTLKMTLRDDVTFTDGQKFNADAAAKNLIRFRDGHSPNKSFLAALKDAKAVDDTHLELTLKESDPGLLIHLSQNAGMMESPGAFNSPDIKTKPVGSGPYVLDTAGTVIGTTYTFTKNPKYWDPSSVHYDKLVLKVLQDPTAMLNAVKGKQLNGAKLSTNDTLDQVKAAGYTLHPFELDWTGLLLLDRGGKINPALKDVRVRQAINYAFDKEGLLKAYGKGHGTVTGQIFPTSSAAYDPALDTHYAYDAAKAKQLLSDAGFANGFELAMPRAAAVGTTLWTLIAQQLKDVGITVKYTDAGNNFIADILAPKYAATWLQLQQDPDWPLINFELTPDAVFNPFHTTDPKVTELVKKVHEAKTDDEAAPALKELNAYVVDQAWFAPWYRIESNYATDAKTDVQPQVGNAYPYLWNFKPKG